MARPQDRFDKDRLVSEREPMYVVFDSSAHTYNGKAGTGSNYKIKPGNSAISAISSEDDGVAILTLPSMAEAAGKFFYIQAPTGASAGDISVYLPETGAEWGTYGQMDADDDHVLAYCTGTKWLAVFDGVA